LFTSRCGLAPQYLVENHELVAAADRRQLRSSDIVSAIEHSQLLDHGCATAFCPTYTIVRPYPSAIPPGVKDVFVWLIETPVPSGF